MDLPEQVPQIADELRGIRNQTLLTSPIGNLLVQILNANNFPAFLGRAAKLALIQQAGGNEYTFSHALLREHFATESQNRAADTRCR